MAAAVAAAAAADADADAAVVAVVAAASDGGAESPASATTTTTAAAAASSATHLAARSTSCDSVDVDPRRLPPPPAPAPELRLDAVNDGINKTAPSRRLHFVISKPNKKNQSWNLELIELTLLSLVIPFAMDCGYIVGLDSLFYSVRSRYDDKTNLATMTSSVPCYFIKWKTRESMPSLLSHRRRLTIIR